MPFPQGVATDDPTPLEQLQIAFAVQVARLIVHADGVIDIDEIGLLQLVFPNELLQKCGFTDERTRLTDRFRRVYDEAVVVLPRALTLDAKLDLVTLFHRAAMADGEVHGAELEVLELASRTLLIDDRDLMQHLAHLRVGSLANLRR